MKYFLFDLDGTLTDSQEGITKSFQFALKECGIIIEDLSDLLKCVGPSITYSFTEFFKLNKEQTEFAIKKYRERFSEIGIFENKPYDGIYDVLQNLLDRGKILAVATSKPQVFTDRIIEKYNFKKYFSTVVGSELNGDRTDKADVISEVIKRLKIDDLSSVVMVGDRKHDILGAKKIKIKSVGVGYGYAKENELELVGADYIAKNMNELNKILINL